LDFSLEMAGRAFGATRMILTDRSAENTKADFPGNPWFNSLGCGRPRCAIWGKELPKTGESSRGPTTIVLSYAYSSISRGL
jgi:hypothetical protein